VFLCFRLVWPPIDSWGGCGVSFCFFPNIPHENVKDPWDPDSGFKRLFSSNGNSLHNFGWNGTENKAYRSSQLLRRRIPPPPTSTPFVRRFLTRLSDRTYWALHSVTLISLSCLRCLPSSRRTHMLAFGRPSLLENRSFSRRVDDIRTTGHLQQHHCNLCYHQVLSGISWHRKPFVLWWYLARLESSVSTRSLEDPQDERDNIRITNLRPLSRSW
jgi:hypothetical protein